ncbi:hypothetical protein ABEB36_007358 [Hypothenemus hampei]|uniref:Uncharacterized protein n=1 Tax=Hypothenemus hampei TaxID=57062 RepID=A0ABD1EXN8_HYPHA
MLPGLCSNILSEHKPGNMEQYLGMFIHSPNSQYLFKCASFIHLFQKVQVLHLFMFSVYYVITNQEPIASRWVRSQEINLPPDEQEPVLLNSVGLDPN